MPTLSLARSLWPADVCTAPARLALPRAPCFQLAPPHDMHAPCARSRVGAPPPPTGQVGSLQTENAALHSRTSILEKVLDMRKEQVQVRGAAAPLQAASLRQKTITWGPGSNPPDIAAHGA